MFNLFTASLDKFNDERKSSLSSLSYKITYQPALVLKH